MKWFLPLMLIATALVAGPFSHKSSPGQFGRGFMTEELTEQDVAEAMEFIEEYGGPEMVSKLKDLKVDAPVKYRAALKRALLEKRDLERLKENEPDLYKKRLRILELRAESFNLAENYRNAKSDGEKNRIKEEMRNVLSKQFDLKEKEKGQRIERLEEEIARLKEELKERKTHKEEIVERRMLDLFGESNYLRW